MNKNIIIGILVAVVVVGGLGYWSIKNSENSATGTSTVTVVNTNDTTDTSNNLPKVAVLQPAQPSVTTASSVGTTDTTAIVTGTVKSNGAPTTYWFEYGKTSDMGSKTASQTIGSGYVLIQTPAYISNLTKDTTYYFRLVAENRLGRVEGNQFTFKTTVGTPVPVGSAPIAKTLSATVISQTTANINGEVTPNKTDTQYWFEYGNTSELGNTSSIASVGSGNSKVSVSTSLVSLEPATTYYFRLNAQNRFGTINGSIFSFKTDGPAAVSAPKVTTNNATGVSATTVSLHGSLNPNGAQTSYWFEYSTDSLLSSVLLHSTDKITLSAGRNITSVREDITDLASKTTYYFRLVAENSQGIVRGDNMSFKTK
ncbi:MAG: hypothetical protein WCG97_02830 [bacterium]